MDGPNTGNQLVDYMLVLLDDLIVQEESLNSGATLKEYRVALASRLREIKNREYDNVLKLLRRQNAKRKKNERLTDRDLPRRTFREYSREKHNARGRRESANTVAGATYRAGRITDTIRRCGVTIVIRNQNQGSHLRLRP